MKQVNIRVTGKDTFLRDTTIGKVYTATRYEAGEVFHRNPYLLVDKDAPAYTFIDDVGDLVSVLAWVSGKYIEEV